MTSKFIMGGKGGRNSERVFFFNFEQKETNQQKWLKNELVSMARLELAFEGRVCTYGSGYLFFYIIQGQESTAVIILTLGARKGKQLLAFITKPVQRKHWGVSAESVSICTSENSSFGK